MSERHDKQDRTDGLAGVVGLTAAAMVIPVVGVFFALRGAVVGLSRLRRPGDRTIGVLLVTLAVIALTAQVGHARLIGDFFGLSRAREKAKQAICGANLKSLGLAMELYQQVNNDSFPAMADPKGRFSREYTADPQRQDTREAFFANEYDCNLQTMWLLVAEEFVLLDIFSCPSDPSFEELDGMGTEASGPGSTGEYAWGFSSWNNSSYAFQPFTGHPENAGRPGTMWQDSSTVIAADRQVPRQALDGNLNHPDGVNVLRNDQTVIFQEYEEEDRSNHLGWTDDRQRNNIYAKDVSAQGVVQTIDEKDLAKRAGQLPDHVNDSVLYWNGTHSPEAGKRSASSTLPVLLIGLVIVVVVVLVAVFLMNKPSKNSLDGQETAGPVGRQEPPPVPKDQNA